ncbi:MAG: hypothetical protein ACOC5M_00250 [Chloroflexota bacterium]
MNLIKLPEQVGEWVRYGWNAAGDLVMVATKGNSDGCVAHVENLRVFSGACEKAIEIGQALVSL